MGIRYCLHTCLSLVQWDTLTKFFCFNLWQGCVSINLLGRNQSFTDCKGVIFLSGKGWMKFRLKSLDREGGWEVGLCEWHHFLITYYMVLPAYWFMLSPGHLVHWDILPNHEWYLGLGKNTIGSCILFTRTYYQMVSCSWGQYLVLEDNILFLRTTYCKVTSLSCATVSPWEHIADWYLVHRGKILPAYHAYLVPTVFCHVGEHFNPWYHVFGDTRYYCQLINLFYPHSNLFTREVYLMVSVLSDKILFIMYPDR